MGWKGGRPPRGVLPEVIEAQNLLNRCLECLLHVRPLDPCWGVPSDAHPLDHEASEEDREAEERERRAAHHAPRRHDGRHTLLVVG